VQPASIHSLPSLLREVADMAHDAIAAGERPLIIGGDHAIAAGTWRGIGRGLGEPPGLIWLDAHLDAHTPRTTHTGNAHGMPLAALLGLGEEAMTGVDGPQLDPARLAVIGVRSYEPEETEHLAGLGVRVYMAEEVKARGLPEIFREARDHLDGGYWGISLDLDSLDPHYAPGVSTPVEGGLSPAELTQAMASVLRLPLFVGMELVEYNPWRDEHGRTAKLAMQLVSSAARAI
jgi:ornithine--oxo-acid transaminase